MNQEDSGVGNRPLHVGPMKSQAETLTNSNLRQPLAHSRCDSTLPALLQHNISNQNYQILVQDIHYLEAMQ